MPTQTGFFSANGTRSTGRPADRRDRQHAARTRPGTSASCRAADAPGAVARRRLPRPGLPGRRLHAGGRGACNGSIPLAVFNQSLARILYQEQRFGMLGCDQTPIVAVHEPGRRRRATARAPRRCPRARRRHAGARHQERRRGDGREELRGGRDAAQERRRRAAADARPTSTVTSSSPARTPTTRSPTRPTRPRPASSTATRSTRCSS